MAGLRPATLLKKRLWYRCFPVNFAKFLGTPFLQNTSGRLLLYTIIEHIWKSYEENKQKELYFSRLLMVFDVFKADTLDNIKALLSNYGTNLNILFPGSNSNC